MMESLSKASTMVFRIDTVAHKGACFGAKGDRSSKEQLRGGDAIDMEKKKRDDRAW